MLNLSFLHEVQDLSDFLGVTMVSLHWTGGKGCRSADFRGIW